MKKGGGVKFALNHDGFRAATYHVGYMAEFIGD
jgi:hypothetical protein